MASDVLIHLLILLLSVAGVCCALWPSRRATVILIGKVDVPPFAIDHPHVIIQQEHSRKEVQLGLTGSFCIRMVSAGSMCIHVKEGGETKQTYQITHQPNQLAIRSKTVSVFDLGVIGTSINLNGDRICQVQCGPGGTLVVRAGHAMDQPVPHNRRLLDHSARMLGEAS